MARSTNHVTDLKSFSFKIFNFSINSFLILTIIIFCILIVYTIVEKSQGGKRIYFKIVFRDGRLTGSRGVTSCRGATG